MTVNSNVNPNFPAPGRDQPTKGFRDNFSTIKTEIESLQAKTIQLTGALTSPPVQIGDGIGAITIQVTGNISNVGAAGSNLSVQYNSNGSLAGSQIYVNGPLVGINNQHPTVALDIVGNLNVKSPNFSSRIEVGSNLRIRSTIYTSNISLDNVVVISMVNSTKNVGIGIPNIAPPPTARLEVLSFDDTISIFRSNIASSNADVRFTSDHTGSSIGLVLNQAANNKSGGMKLDRNGNISLHVNGTGNSHLLDSTMAVRILTNGNVGVNTLTPTQKFEVLGNISISNVTTSNGIVFADNSFQSTAANVQLINSLATFNTVQTTVVNASITANTLPLDLSAGRIFFVPMNSNVSTVNVTNSTPNVYQSFQLQSTANGTGYTQAWPGTWTWLTGTPVLSTTNGKRDLFQVWSFNGTDWFASTIAQFY